MPQVVGFSEALSRQVRARDDATRVPFLASSSATPHKPVAFLSRGDPGRIIGPHYHIVDQFQLIAEGKGRLGRHAVAPFSLHFSRAYTPYGPLVADDETGLSFFTLRAKFDPGAEWLPASKDKLKQHSDRRPWQISRQVLMPVPVAGAGSGVATYEIPDIKDERGLFARSMTLLPDVRVTGPDPACGGGQYLVVTGGSIRHNEQDHEAFTVVFLEPDDRPFELQAGAAGANVIVMNFPKPTMQPAAAMGAHPGTSGKKWKCVLCSFVYDEAAGALSEGIAAGTRWQDIPDTWTCPDCAAGKEDFQMTEAD